MKLSRRFLRSLGVITPCLATVAVAVACSSDNREFGLPGGSGGKPNEGAAGSGAHAGLTGSGGILGVAGIGAAGAGTAGAPVFGEAGQSGGGASGAGGAAHAGGGSGGKSGGGSGGKSGTGGSSGTGGKAGSTSVGSGGAAGAGAACDSTTTLTGGTTVQSNNKTGTAAGLDWAIWSNGTGGSITTYSVPAFSAAWNNSGDFLARIGLQWNATKTYDALGTVTAQYSYKKTGTGGGYSYIGMYGWSVSPCVEWYIVDDSYNKMPVNPGMTTNNGTADIDGGKYTLYSRPTTGTGGSKCSGTSSWTQFYSIRQTARQCGQISVTQHFAAWAAAGMTLGKMDQAQILIEVGGGMGTIDFSVANVTLQ